MKRIWPPTPRPLAPPLNAPRQIKIRIFIFLPTAINMRFDALDSGYPVRKRHQDNVIDAPQRAQASHPQLLVEIRPARSFVTCLSGSMSHQHIPSALASPNGRCALDEANPRCRATARSSSRFSKRRKEPGAASKRSPLRGRAGRHFINNLHQT